MSLVKMTNVVDNKEHDVWVKLSAIESVIPHYVDDEQLFMFLAGGRWFSTRENPADVQERFNEEANKRMMDRLSGTIRLPMNWPEEAVGKTIKVAT